MYFNFAHKINHTCSLKTNDIENNSIVFLINIFVRVISDVKLQTQSINQNENKLTSYCKSATVSSNYKDIQHRHVEYIFTSLHFLKRVGCTTIKSIIIEWDDRIFSLFSIVTVNMGVFFAPYIVIH